MGPNSGRRANPYIRRGPPGPAPGESAPHHAGSIREGSFGTVPEYAACAGWTRPEGRRGELTPASGDPSRPSNDYKCDRWLVAQPKGELPDVPDYRLPCDSRAACRAAASPASVYRDAARNWRAGPATIPARRPEAARRHTVAATPAAKARPERSRSSYCALPQLHPALAAGNRLARGAETEKEPLGGNFRQRLEGERAFVMPEIRIPSTTTKIKRFVSPIRNDQCHPTYASPKTMWHYAGVRAPQ